MSMPGNLGFTPLDTAFIEIALGVLAAGAGTVALKKIIELITEDLYKCAKDFAKGHSRHRKTREFDSRTTQLQRPEKTSLPARALLIVNRTVTDDGGKVWLDG